MNCKNQQSQPVELLAKYNFTSEFFTNFINETSVDHASSNVSMSSIEHFQYSVNEQKFKLFHAENLINIWWTISKREIIQRWILNKQYIKTLEKRTPNHLTKTLLKVFYTIAVKLQVKYSLAFRKLLRHHQDNNQRPENQRAKEKQTKLINTVLQKLEGSLPSLSKKFDLQNKRNFFNILKQLKKVQTNKQIISNDYLQTYNEIWKAKHHNNNIENKIQILVGTLNLTIHLLMRQVFLIISLHKQSLEENNISHIQPMQKESFKMVNNSIEAQLMHNQLFQENQPIIIHNQAQLPLYSTSKDDNYENIPQEKKQEFLISEFIDKHNPKHLKFSKDTKRKIIKSIEYQNNQCEPIVHNTDNIDRSITKSQAEQNSYIKRNSIINSSEFHSRSFVKKVYHPIQFYPPTQSYKVITLLEENDLPPQLNQQQTHKTFQNINNNTKARPLKHLELRNQFADFSMPFNYIDDLFFISEMTDFYKTITFKNSKNNSSEKPKKSISLAKIKEKISNKTIEQYFQKHKKSTENLFHDFLTRRYISSSYCVFYLEPSIDYSQGYKKSAKKSQHSRDNRQMSNSNVHAIFKSDKNLRNTSQNHHIIRIPSRLPQYFDYYVDKSIKRNRNQDQQPVKVSSLAHENIYTQRKQKRSVSKSNKKIFNTVKSSTNRLSTQPISRSKKTIQNGSFVSSCHKLDVQNLSKPKLQPQKKYSKQQGQKQSIENINRGQYYIGFRDPPKKKIKKNI